MKETAALLHVERHAVGEWVKRFTEQGLEGLADGISLAATGARLVGEPLL